MENSIAEIFSEVELPKIVDRVRDDETFAAGFSPTRSGNYVNALLVKPEMIDETTEAQTTNR